MFKGRDHLLVSSKNFSLERGCHISTEELGTKTRQVKREGGRGEAEVWATAAPNHIPGQPGRPAPRRPVSGLPGTQGPVVPRRLGKRPWGP